MSEYQYYEFQAIDRPLSDRQMEELRALSSRAEITRTSFVNTYNYGDFRGDPHKLMVKYFDAFLYVANWGTHRLMLRVPRGLLDVRAAGQYEVEGAVGIDETADHVIVELTSAPEDGGGEWEEGEGLLSALLPLRDALLEGDLRPLYLGWLSGVQWLDEEYDAEAFDEPEPPVPPGLGRLTRPLRDLAEFLRIDDDLLRVAAAASAPATAAAGLAEAELAAWLGKLPAAEKDALLLSLFDDKAPNPRWEILRRFREARAPLAPGAETGPRRTVRELRGLGVSGAAEREQREAEERAREQQRREQEQARAREKHLKSLAGREEHLWQQAEELAQTKRPKEYDQAVELLRDLRDLASRAATASEFAARLGEFSRRHAPKRSLLERLRRAGL
jgi:hypothetical protein